MVSAVPRCTKGYQNTEEKGTMPERLQPYTSHCQALYRKLIQLSEKSLHPSLKSTIRRESNKV